MHAWRKRLTLHGKTVLARPGETKEEFEDRRRQGWGVVETVAADCKKFKVDKLIVMLKEGKDIAQVSDAGTPAISDPGSYLVQSAWEAGIIIPRRSRDRSRTWNRSAEPGSSWWRTTNSTSWLQRIC